MYAVLCLVHVVHGLVDAGGELYPQSHASSILSFLMKMSHTCPPLMSLAPCQSFLNLQNPPKSLMDLPLIGLASALCHCPILHDLQAALDTTTPCEFLMSFAVTSLPTRSRLLPSCYYQPVRMGSYFASPNFTDY